MTDDNPFTHEVLFSREMTLNPMQLAVEGFMKAGGQTVFELPTLPSDEVRDLRIKLMTEELLGKAGDKAGNKSDELVESMRKGDIVGIADGIADLLYVVFGTAAAYGLDAQACFDEAHRSNMTKCVWDEEKQEYNVIRDEAGKILKPDTYEPADFESVILKAYGIEYTVPSDIEYVDHGGFEDH